MTYGTLKRTVLALLDVNAEEQETAGSLLATVSASFPSLYNTVARKTTQFLKNIEREVLLSFEPCAGGVCAPLPTDFMAVCEARVFDGGHARDIEIRGNTAFIAGGAEGEYTLRYFAYPAPADGMTDGATVLDFDDFTADTVAYGMAAELCHSLYPGDMTRYMRLATEYDERIANAAPRIGERSVVNRVFGRRRGGVQ